MLGESAGSASSGPGGADVTPTLYESPNCNTHVQYRCIVVAVTRSPDAQVTIKFVRDFQTSDGSVSYSRGSEFVVDAATADALLLAGVVVTVSATTA